VVPHNYPYHRQRHCLPYAPCLAPPPPPSFPTRRSSDLSLRSPTSCSTRALGHHQDSPTGQDIGIARFSVCARLPKTGRFRCPGRSEEHTSELQSRSDLVCRLLLEKKKINNSIKTAKTYC